MFFVRVYLLYASNLLLLITLLWIFHRKFDRQHPLFVIYLVLQLAYFLSAATVDFLIARHSASRTVYLWTLILGLGLSAVAEVAVLYELTVELIFSRLRSAATYKAGLRWTLGVLLLLGVVIAASLESSSPEPLANVFQDLNTVVYVISLGLLFGIILLTKALNIRWRSLHAGVALGLGIAAAGELAGSGVLSEFGKNRSGYIAADLIRMSAFHACALIWLIYVFLPEKQPPKHGSSLSVADLQSQAEELQRMLPR